ncbi:MAG TPA: LytTR family DNA-binding domain-containing protein [Caldimonas sp.]|jgi:DNA-binding LytR/AlgR family response regulator|nr:LytTR family DNA-binding domain-containing protein [Caldimonas sp.]HEX2542041.1 LytTR family DNA-binding domain-containing protein [Caldimonas sp.]
MRVFVVEDEVPARDRLLETIARVEPQAQVVGTAGSVREARAWLAAHPPPDLMLLDVQLSDGLSLDLFRDGAIASPAIFATAYDEFVLQAFRANAIDYVLKPVSDAALARAFESYRRLRTHFAPPLATILDGHGSPPSPPPPRQRLLARRGSGFVSLRVDEIACFVSLDKLTFAVDAAGTRHLVETSLGELEGELDGRRFFRVNRQVIASAGAIVGFRSAGKGRLDVQLAPPGLDTISVTQERAAAFREWLGR